MKLIYITLLTTLLICPNLFAEHSFKSKEIQATQKVEQQSTENLALKASVSTSNVSDWEDLHAVNDGNEPKSSTDRTYPIYGNWRGDASYGQEDWVQYEWNYAHQISQLSVYWFTDNGGLGKPTTAHIEYWFGNEWHSAGEIGTDLNRYNTLNVKFSASKVRITMKSNTQTGICEWKVFGVETLSCDPETITALASLNQTPWMEKNLVTAQIGDSVSFYGRPSEKWDGVGLWNWSGPNQFSSSDSILKLGNVNEDIEGSYKLTFTNSCGNNTTQFFYLSILDEHSGEAYSWPIYSPTISYDFHDEYPNLSMPTKNLPDCSQMTNVDMGWWTFAYGPNKRSLITDVAIQAMLKKFNDEFTYIRETMGWPPDKRAKNGYRSAIYLYGSGLCSDNADSTDTGGWQSATEYNNSSWPMVLASYYPVYCFDPSSAYTDKAYQTDAMIHEGIHSILADMPGCKKAAWFHEGGNTWLQQEMASSRTGNSSSMGFLNAGALVAPFMPIECYSGWLQDESFGGPSAEGVDLYDGDTKLCTWKNLLGGTQYGNLFPVYLGLTLGNKSVPWIWRYCETRVLEGIANGNGSIKGLGDIQTRRLIMEYRAKQALLDMGKWTNACKKLLNDYVGGSVKEEYSPYWKSSPAWTITPYAKTTESNRVLTPEYRTTPGWSGGNQIPLVLRPKTDSIVVKFLPMAENMTCQLCYRTKTGLCVYSKPVSFGDCILRIDQEKWPANGVVIAVICNTDYIYKGEETRKAHYDYRLEMGYGIYGKANINKKWYLWTSSISTEVENIYAQDEYDVTIFPSSIKAGHDFNIDFPENISGETKMEMYSPHGMKIFEQSLMQRHSSLTLPSGLPQGIYIVSICTPHQRFLKKIMIEE